MLTEILIKRGVLGHIFKGLQSAGKKLKGLGEMLFGDKSLLKGIKFPVKSPTSAAAPKKTHKEAVERLLEEFRNRIDNIQNKELVNLPTGELNNFLEKNVENWLAFYTLDSNQMARIFKDRPGHEIRQFIKSRPSHEQPNILYRLMNSVPVAAAKTIDDQIAASLRASDRNFMKSLLLEFLEKNIAQLGADSFVGVTNALESLGENRRNIMRLASTWVKHHGYLRGII